MKPLAYKSELIELKNYDGHSLELGMDGISIFATAKRVFLHFVHSNRNFYYYDSSYPLLSCSADDAKEVELRNVLLSELVSIFRDKTMKNLDIHPMVDELLSRVLNIIGPSFDVKEEKSHSSKQSSAPKKTVKRWTMANVITKHKGHESFNFEIPVYGSVESFHLLHELTHLSILVFKFLCKKDFKNEDKAPIEAWFQKNIGGSTSATPPDIPGASNSVTNAPVVPKLPKTTTVVVPVPVRNTKAEFAKKLEAFDSFEILRVSCGVGDIKKGEWLGFMKHLKHITDRVAYDEFKSSYSNQKK